MGRGKTQKSQQMRIVNEQMSRVSVENNVPTYKQRVLVGKNSENADKSAHAHGKRANVYKRKLRYLKYVISTPASAHQFFEQFPHQPAEDGSTPARLHRYLVSRSASTVPVSPAGRETAAGQRVVRSR